MKGPAVKPSDTIRREYQAALQAFVRRMNMELMQEISRAYTSREVALPSTEVTRDASPVEWLKGKLSDFFDGWHKKINAMADKRAKWFADQMEKSSSKQIQKMLRDIGFTVEFKNSAYVTGELEKIIEENVALMRSIPERMHKKVEKIITHGLTAGNDQRYIATELQKEFGVTERRARLIALDQTNKANAAISIHRSAEAGIEYGFWLHRSGSKKPRPTHIKMSGYNFKLSEGLHDPDPKVNRKIMPGELVACRCAYRPDLSSFRPQLAQDSVIIRPLKTTYADILGRVANSLKEAA